MGDETTLPLRTFQTLPSLSMKIKDPKWFNPCVPPARNHHHLLTLVYPSLGTLASLPFLKQARHNSISGPLHLLLPILRIPQPQKSWASFHHFLQILDPSCPTHHSPVLPTCLGIWFSTELSKLSVSLSPRGGVSVSLSHWPDKNIPLWKAWPER